MQNTLALTLRQMEVVKLLADGLCIKEVSAQLGMSARTAQTHVANIYDRLDIHNRVTLVNWYFNQTARRRDTRGKACERPHRVRSTKTTAATQGSRT